MCRSTISIIGMGKREKTHVVKLLEIRNIIEKSSAKFNFEKGDVTITRINDQLNDLSSKFDELRDLVITAKSRGDSPRKIKTKKDVITMLMKHGRLNPERLGKLIGLSRARANEYLKELEGEGITRGIEVGKKKFYTLHEDFLEQKLERME